MWIQERKARVGTADLCHEVHGADEDRLRQLVARLAVPRHRLVNARSNRLIRDDLCDAFRGYGFDVQIQGHYQNVVALPPQTACRPIVLVAAHYDSVPDCPGADDNASGLAVMLECSRILGPTARSLGVGFIAFNAEEDQLAGSSDFVANGLGNLPAVRWVHVLEMVGFRAPGQVAEPLPLPWTPAILRSSEFIGLVAKGPSNAVVNVAVTATTAPRLHVLAARTWGPLHRWFPDLSRSDHFPFWDAHLPAVLWTDTGNFRNPNYHRATDTPDTLDYVFMCQVTELLCAVLSKENRR